MAPAGGGNRLGQPGPLALTDVTARLPPVIRVVVADDQALGRRNSSAASAPAADT